MVKRQLSTDDNSYARLSAYKKDVVLILIYTNFQRLRCGSNNRQLVLNKNLVSIRKSLCLLKINYSQGKLEKLRIILVEFVLHRLVGMEITRL